MLHNRQYPGYIFESRHQLWDHRSVIRQLYSVAGLVSVRNDRELPYLVRSQMQHRGREAALRKRQELTYEQSSA